MNDKHIDLKKAVIQERLALLGLAAERRQGAEPCPDAEQFALFLEAQPGSAEQKRFLAHLAACEFCRQKWLSLADELDSSSGKKTETRPFWTRRGLMSLAGSACAVAVGVMLYLAIDYPSGQRVSDGVPAGEGKIKAPAEQALRLESRDAAVPMQAEEEVAADAAGLEPAVEMSATQLKKEMQQSDRPEPGPVRRLAEAPAERYSANRAKVDQEGFSGAGMSAELPGAFKVFLESLQAHCEERKPAVSLTASATDTLEQGRNLLGSSETLTPAQKALVDEIVRLLSGPEPVKDTELDRLCTEARRLAAKTQ